MQELKNYWENRNARASSTGGSLLKRLRLTQSLVDVVFSVRASDEVFIAQSLRKSGARSVLDLGCGAGKAVIPSIADYTAGVDIAGYPADTVLAKGYTECVEYSPPRYEFQISRTVDAITAINVNAHIPVEAYKTMLNKGLEFLSPGGILVLIHEYDNDGLSYKWMRRNRRKFDRFVKGMEHWHLEHESETMGEIDEILQDLKLVARRPLTGGLLSAAHYYAYFAEKDPSPQVAKLLTLADVPISVVNFVHCRVTPGKDKCFLVGYVFQKQF